MSTAPAVDSGGKAPAEDTARAVGSSKWTAYVLLSPGMLWLAIFFLVPTAVMVSTSLQSGNIYDGFAFTAQFSNYSDAVSQYGATFVKSLAFALIATVICLAVAYPLAYTIAFKSGRWRNVLLVLVIAPFFTSFLLRTNAWGTIFSDNYFPVKFMHSIGLLTVLHAISTDWLPSWLSWFNFFPNGITAADHVLATPGAVITGIAYNFLPFMTLPLFASLDRIDVRLIEAATDLYSSAWTAFRKVTFPLSLPGVVAGTLLTFIPAAGDPVNARMLGSPSDALIGNAIDSQFTVTANYPLASALSVILMFIIVVMVAFYVRRAGTEELV
jgi:spermidine/putrescine transport system permease protein